MRPLKSLETDWRRAPRKHSEVSNYAALVAVAHGNRTHRGRLSSPATGFEDRAGHQIRTRYRGGRYQVLPVGRKGKRRGNSAQAQLELAAPVAGCVAVDAHDGMQTVASRRAQGAEYQRACDERSRDGDGRKPGGHPVRPRERGDEQGEKDREAESEGDQCRGKRIRVGAGDVAGGTQGRKGRRRAKIDGCDGEEG